MACADVDMDIQVDQEPSGAGRREAPPPPDLAQYYQATAMVKDEGQRRAMKQKHSVYGSMQIATGLFSIAVGILSAVTKEITYSYMTMFRLSYLTGVLFLFVGVTSNMLHKFPALRSMVIMANLGSIAVAIIAVCLISVDLAYGRFYYDLYMRMELLELLVLCFEVFLSAALCYCFSKQKRAKSP
ncbi:uncharacterized protein si:ch211-269k10.4 [Oryzias melastigma]|uniref:uncharacterized protein si:ch211-269k10.4 n=1 Tax=Oryzias melastigma TaxID=30732 RepID=UPI00168D2D37|nr:uncharacterized protein si:ch211-269k10.4 [Oryzias melastigma]XP_036071720.1 uncharacterized protein si:ch211-269k10.4 [Oryzias melastigma]